jgi:hypothetical protein
VTFLVNVIWKHLLAAVLSNWGSTVSGVIEAILIGGGSLAVYFHDTPLQQVSWAGFGLAAWRLASKSLQAKFSWSSIFGAMLSGAPRAQLADMTKENTTKK